MILFQELAKEWNIKLRELEYNGKDGKEIPELHQYGSCVIGECMRTANVETFKLNRNDPDMPRCYICFHMARDPIILDIAYGRKVKENIKRFYKELVPQIEKHYTAEHGH